MAIIEDLKGRKPYINLKGPEGNAFALLGYAKQIGKDNDLDWKSITEEMQAGDYEHLLAVFDTHFGEYVDLIR
jgi:hypothetical protein